MKTIILSLAGVLVLIGGTIGVKAIQGHADQQESPAVVSDNNNDEVMDHTSAATDFPEVAEANTKADLDAYDIKVVADNSEKRVLLYMDEQGQPVYKSILVKRKNLHKLINLQSGQEESVTLDEQQDPSSSNQQQESKEYPELAKIGDEIDLDDYSTKTLEDNQQKRILLFEDEQGHAAYKSIFIKKTNKVELINVAGKGKTTITLP